MGHRSKRSSGTEEAPLRDGRDASRPSPSPSRRTLPPPCYTLWPPIDACKEPMVMAGGSIGHTVVPCTVSVLASKIAGIARGSGIITASWIALPYHEANIAMERMVRTTSATQGTPEMSRVIIATTGTSIARHLPPDRLRGDKEAALHAIRERLQQIYSEASDAEQYLRQASAETNSLQLLEANRDDRLYLLHTDTTDGRVCADAVARLVEETLGIPSRRVEIVGLQVNDPQRFRRIGVQNLFAKISQIRRDHPNNEVLLNGTGGFKSMVAYLTLYGLLYRLPVTYIFEFSNNLLHFPPAPIHFDYDRLARAADAIAALKAEGCLAKEEFFRRIVGLEYHDRDWYGSLLEEDQDGTVTLGAFGQLLDDALEMKKGQIFLSPSANAAYQASAGGTRQRFNALLVRVEEPLWRQLHAHAFSGTDLSVWKIGRTAERMAGREQGRDVYVCELYADHAQYERELPRHEWQDYDRATFTRWWLPEDQPAPPQTDDEVAAKLGQECRQLEEENRQLTEKWVESETQREAAVARMTHLEAEYERLLAETARCERELVDRSQQAEAAAAKVAELLRQLAECQQTLQEARRP